MDILQNKNGFYSIVLEQSMIFELRLTKHETPTSEGVDSKER